MYDEVGRVWVIVVQPGGGFTQVEGDTMATENLAQMADGQLMKLFSISSAHGIGKRQKQIMAELERRGYLFDREHKDFVTCEQWNARHGDMPIDCEQRARWFDSP